MLCDKADLRGRLRSLNDKTHIGARNELLVFDFCRASGLQPQRNPVFNGLTPDYSIELSPGENCVLEVATVFEDAEIEKHKDQVYEVLDRLGEAAVAYNFCVGVLAWPADRISPGKVTRNILWTLKQSSGYPTERVNIDLNQFGIKGEIIALPCDREDKPLVMLTEPVLGGAPTQQMMSVALQKKIRKYKHLNLPYIIAICSTDLFPMNERALISILYGSSSSKGLISREENLL